MSMKLGDVVARLYLAFIVVLIWLPIAFMILLSFKTGGNVSFPIEGLTVDWYIARPKGYEYISYISVLYDKAFWQALQNSALVSTAVGAVTCLTVTATGLALRHRVVGRDILFYLILLGFIVPGVSLGLGHVVMYKQLDLEFTFWSAVAVDVIFTVPFGLVLMMARFDPDLMLYEQAASVLKASPIAVFRRVTMPLIKWEILVAGVLGFVLSWSELVRTSFVMKGTGVLATYIFNQMQINPVTPKWYAAGTVIASVSFVGLILVGYIMSRTAK